ncbi:orexin receptor type 2-like [Euwallacea similis]|uniref:orexin receptor type 2-like n=1 Tax=Euwallacea similis TaxID=1736056 RepID=UPI00344D5361
MESNWQLSTTTMNSTSPDEIERILAELSEEDEFIMQDSGHSTFAYIMFTSGFLIFLVAFIGSTLVCYTVFKFIAFRTRTNYLLIHFFIASSLFSVVCGLQMCVSAIIPNVYIAYKFIFSLQTMLLSVTCFMTLLLAFDWYSLAHWHGTFIKFAKYYKWIIGSFYSAIFVVFFLTHLISLLSTIFEYFTILCYLTTLITVIAWNVMRLRRTYTTEIMKTYYAFASATMYILMWIPFIFIVIVHSLIFGFGHTENWFEVFDEIMIWLTRILVCVPMVSPGLIAFLLTRWDTQFKVGFGHVLKMNFARNDDPNGDVAYVNYTSNECFEEDVKPSGCKSTHIERQ